LEILTDYIEKGQEKIESFNEIKDGFLKDFEKETNELSLKI
jgi:hypothetical protein